MKYIILVGDGMADHPIDELGGKTPLNVANKPNMNYLAAHGINGLVATVPEKMTPESDTANLALMGYDPTIYSRGRSPLEALSMGIDMQPDETAIRANIVSLSDNGEPYEEKIMLDHSADEIPTGEARVLISAIQEKFGDAQHKFYPGVSYRHCLIWKDCPVFDDYMRPHDILGRKIKDYLPQKPTSQPFRQMMKDSFDVLNNHPVNDERRKRGLKSANSLWFWGPGKKPHLPPFEEITGLKASVVCAVDLIKGIGICAGMDAPHVDGATGNIDTNFRGKADVAFNELLDGKDLVYIHIEAPDECGHRGELNNKIKSIEIIDNTVLGYLMKKLKEADIDYKILLLPDHPTPCAVRTHTHEPVPFVIYSSTDIKNSGIDVYDEQGGLKSGVYLSNGYDMMKFFLQK